MISEESYRLVTGDELQKYKLFDWFNKETYYIAEKGYFIPEKYLIKDLDKKKFWRLKLDELLKEFNFERVHKVMKALDWSWAGVNGIPKKEDMIPVIEGLYDTIEPRILQGKSCYCSTGGFKLVFNPDEDEELSLTFEAESYWVYGD